MTIFAGTKCSSARNVGLYPWFKFAQSLIFWQATWFLYFQDVLTPAKAIILYAAYDIATTILEVPAGYLSDRIGRRPTLIFAAIAGGVSALMQATGDQFAVFVAAQVFLGASSALASGTDSALLYESLNAEGRADEMERQSLISWRYGFVGLAVSAFLGGLMAYAAPVLPYFATAAAFLLMLTVALRFAEPAQRSAGARDTGAELRALIRRFRHPVLLWLLALGVAMYVFSHLPFVFGQPFVLQALAGVGLAAEAPVISGAVTAIMMLVSVVTSLFALGLRNRIGLPAILICAFAIQIAIIIALALSNAVIIIAVLFLRMVPNSLSQPFIQARVQPLLDNATRATFLSVESFAGRLLFALTLFLASGNAMGVDAMAHGEIRNILATYALAGGAILAGLVAVALRVRIDDRDA